MKMPNQPLTLSAVTLTFIVDVSLPDGNGFELCDEIKRVCETPVIFLTALDDEDSIVKGFDLGAEDYITKPFSSRELLARIKRITKKLDKTMTMNFGDISIDFDKNRFAKRQSRCAYGA